MLTLNLLGFAK